ncbi:MAG: DUF3999 family protein [Candidatus Omnitrophota bacterium]
MRRLISLVPVAAIFIFLSTAAFCDVTAKYWEFNRPIRVSETARRAVAIPLDAQVFNAAKPGLSDLRVTDSKGGESPYAIFSQADTTKDEKLSSVVLSAKVMPAESVITAELKAPLKPFNRIVVIPESDNFARRITIEGSNDNKRWEIIRRGISVYSFSYQTTEHYFEQYTNETYIGYGFGSYSENKLSVSFPESAYKFVRVTVPHDKDKEPVKLKSLEIFNAVGVKAEEDSFKGAIINRLPCGADKAVENIVDFGSKGLRLSRIDLAAAQSNFFRRVEVEGSDDLKKWTSTGSGVIFSISVDDEPEQNLTLELRDSGYRYLKVKIFNGDNKPISLISVTGYSLKKFLVIIPDGSERYALLYGNPAAKQVNYDLGDVIRGKTIGSFGKGHLAAEIRNDKYVPYKEARPWTEEHPYILWVAMLGIIIGLIFLGGQVVRKVEKK